MMQFGVASPAALIPVSPFGSPAFPDGTGTGFVSRDTRRDDVPADAPCRAPPLRREQHRGRGGEPEPSRQQLTKATAVIGSERLPPIGPSPSAPSLVLRCGFLGPHWYLRFAPSTQLPTCVHRCCAPARSLLLTRFFTGALGATRRLPISATEWTYEHTLEHSNPHRIQGATRKQRTVGDSGSCEPRQPSFIRPSGTAVRIDDVYVPPTATTARRGGFTSTCRARTPRVVNRCQRRTRKKYSTNDRAVYGLPFGNQLTELVVPKHDSPYRVASYASSRKVTQSCCTRGAFLLLSPRKKRG